MVSICIFLLSCPVGLASHKLCYPACINAACISYHSTLHCTNQYVASYLTKPMLKLLLHCGVFLLFTACHGYPRFASSDASVGGRSYGWSTDCSTGRLLSSAIATGRWFGTDDPAKDASSRRCRSSSNAITNSCSIGVAWSRVRNRLQDISSFGHPESSTAATAAVNRSALKNDGRVWKFFGGLFIFCLHRVACCIHFLGGQAFSDMKLWIFCGTKFWNLA